MDFKQLEAFAAVVSLGSFSKAGERLFLTQPTISAHISSLEKELGVRLIVRTTKQVYPSDEGKRLYLYAQNILRLRDDAISAITAASPQMKGTVSIAASTIPSQYVLPEVMAGFRKEYPHIVFRITHCDSAEVTQRVADGECEVGMTGAVINPSKCVYHDFTDDELVVITPDTEAYRSLGKSGFPVQALLQHPFIQREAGSGTRREYERFLEEIGISAARLRVVAEMEDPEAIKQSVSQGLGISIISRRAISDFSRFGLLLAFPLAHGAIDRRLYLVCRKSGHPSAEVRAFVDFVLRYYGHIR
ncbi:selenium metabolism-associated LysR family transcriptional regulator [Oscillospiraceae bacterium PP1C4]